MSEAPIALNAGQLDGLIRRVQEAGEHELALSGDDLRLLLNALLMLTELQNQMAAQDMTIRKLRKLAGIVKNSEQLKDLVPGAITSDKPDKGKTPRKNKPKTKSEKPPPPARCFHNIEGLEKGQACPECERGKLYKYEPALVLRISGQTPLTSVQHILERLRCNTCGAYFTAQAPPEVTLDGPIEQQYGYTARALMGIQKYFAGAPFYRQQTLQQLLGRPVSASSVFDQCEQLANAIQPLFACLIALAGNAVLYLIDDTTNRILSQGPIQKPDRRTGKLKERTGIYTSAAIATLGNGHQCVLYQTNIGHAGEWLDELLRTRPPTAPPPLVMSDASSNNRPSVIADYHPVLCNSHGRREYVEVIAHFPDQVEWVLERYSHIWRNETHCQEHQLSAAQRLAYHQAHSLPIMEQIRDWGNQQLEHATVEANSGLGQAIGYFGRHFEGLTAFCRFENAPIDNNQTEQVLKLIIRGRKNALFFKTPAGAAIADVITSVVATAEQAGINAFDYLVALQRHQQAVRSQPEQWLPWNYPIALELEKTAAVENAVAAEKKAA